MTHNSRISFRGAITPTNILFHAINLSSSIELTKVEIYQHMEMLVLEKQRREELLSQSQSTSTLNLYSSVNKKFSSNHTSSNTYTSNTNISSTYVRGSTSNNNNHTDHNCQLLNTVIPGLPFPLLNAPLVALNMILRLGFPMEVWNLFTKICQLFQPANPFQGMISKIDMK